MTWLSGWGKRIKITVDSGDIDGDLTHFPLMVHLSAACGIAAAFDASPIFDEVGASSQKIAVTKDDEVTEIYVEVEYWDSGSEEAILWVSKSDLVIANASDTDLYIYYDSTHADNTDYIGLCADGSAATHAVWDANFKGVFHLRDVTTSTILDSTSNNNDGTKKGANEPQEVTGAHSIGKGQDFDGGDDEIDHGNDTTLRITPTLTLEAWVRFDALETVLIGYAGIWDTGAGKRSYSFYTGSTAADKHMRFVASDDGTWNAGHRCEVLETGNYAIDTWYQYTVTFNSGSPKMYRDGADVTNVALDQITTIDQDTANFMIGCHLTSGNPQRWFNGKMDEVRVSDIVRSAEYIKACYECQRDHILSFAAEETVPVVAVAGASIIPLLGVLDIL